MRSTAGGQRTEGSVRDTKTGATFKTTKGAPHVLLKLVNPEPGIKAAVERDVHALGLRGIRSLAVAKTDDNGTWRMLGLLTFLDPPRPDTKQTIADARSNGVAVKMITGDHLLIAKETARALDMGHLICSSEGLPMLDPTTKVKPVGLSRDYGDLCLAADGFAQVFPEHKYLIVECLRELGYKVGMTGDGVNDAPALKRADVGIAVAGATDAARAAADIILTEEGLSTIIHGIVIARCIFARIRNFITYRIAATLQLLVFFFIAVFAFKPLDYQPAVNPDDEAWPEFFHMPVLMLMLITLLNDGTLISIGYDNVKPRATPEVWNLRVVFCVGSVLAAVACASSLLLLWWCLDSWNPTGVFQTVGIGGLSYGQITTAIYLKVSISDFRTHPIPPLSRIRSLPSQVSVSDFLTLFSSRGGPDWFWATRPANILLGAAGISLSLSTILACAWPASYPGRWVGLVGSPRGRTPNILTSFTSSPLPRAAAAPRRHLRVGPRPPPSVCPCRVHVRSPRGRVHLLSTTHRSRSCSCSRAHLTDPPAQLDLLPSVVARAGRSQSGHVRAPQGASVGKPMRRPAVR